MIISEFINKLIINYAFEKIDDEKFKNSLKMKISRTINNDPELSKLYEMAPTKKVSKTIAKDLDNNFLDKLENKLRPYLLKFRNINNNDYNYVKSLFELSKESPKTITSFLNDTIPNIKNKEDARMSKLDKLYLMVETLFNEKYELDEATYYADVLTVTKLINIPDVLTKIKNNEPIPDMHILTESLTRLDKPGKYYVHKKKNR